MNLKIFLSGLVLFLSGIFFAELALSEGPASWAVSQEFFWGTPIADFVFWIGLAHAGTFFSAILLVLGAGFQRRVALVAELSTVAALLVAGMFPLLHLGLPFQFYEMVPIGNFRGYFANVASPLVWDFLAIFSYATLSSLYLILHVCAVKFPALGKFGKPFAWILFPLVLWVHTIVSMDFAVTIVPEWGGGHLPPYFVFGALYSGVALVLALLALFGKRVRRVEEILLALSWAMLAFWIWEAFSKNVWHSEILVFGFLVPQVFWISRARDFPFVRVGVSVSVLCALWWERILLVQPEPLRFTSVDWGLFPFGVGVFLLAFSTLVFFVRKIFGMWSPGENSECEVFSGSPFAVRPFAVSVVCGVFSASLLAVYFVCNSPDVSFEKIVPALFPVAAIVAGVSLSVFAASEIFGWRRSLAFVFSLAFLALAAGGAVYRGRETSYAEPRISVENEKIRDGISRNAEMLWNARCAACHGKDGNFNRKFVHEFYPLPQRLSGSRLDSLGTDSLSRVILEGRRYMRPFAGRISESEARALSEYLRVLAGKKETEK